MTMDRTRDANIVSASAASRLSSTRRARSEPIFGPSPVPSTTPMKTPRPATMDSSWATAMPPARTLPTSLPGLPRNSLLSSVPAWPVRMHSHCGSSFASLRCCGLLTRAARRMQVSQIRAGFPARFRKSPRILCLLPPDSNFGPARRCCVAFGASARLALSSLVRRSQPG